MTHTEIASKLDAAGVDSTSLKVDPTGTWTLNLPGGAWVAFGETDTTHPDYDPQYAGWIDATVRDDSGNEIYIGGADLDAVVAQIAARVPHTVLLTRTTEDAEGAYIETMTLTRDGDEVRQTFTTDGEITADGVAHTGAGTEGWLDTEGWLRDRLVEYRADGWREIS